MCSNFILNYKLSIIKTSFFIINILYDFHFGASCQIPLLYQNDQNDEGEHQLKLFQIQL